MGRRVESAGWTEVQRNADPEYQRLWQEIRDDPSLMEMANTAYRRGVSHVRQEREAQRKPWAALTAGYSGSLRNWCGAG